MNEWFRSPAAWTALGFVGQLLFGSRFFVQWWASERKKRVVIPTAFWVLSTIGGATLFAYAIHQRDPVFALGQGSGLLIYLRNLKLSRADQPDATTPRESA
jgi:lipid-A-disaccharide synthase-like uncharacterized protein